MSIPSTLQPVDLYTPAGLGKPRRWGRTSPESPTVDVYIHSDREYRAVPKREIMPEEWDIRVMAEEVAAISGCHYSDVLRELRSKLTIPSGRTRPDLTENADVGDRHPGPRPRR